MGQNTDCYVDPYLMKQRLEYCHFLEQIPVKSNGQLQCIVKEEALGISSCSQRAVPQRLKIIGVACEAVKSAHYA